MSPCWLLSNCSIALFIISWNSLINSSQSPLVDFWQAFFVFSFFLITCMILRWLFCHLSLPCFSSTFTWLSCHFTSLWWQASWGLFPCTQWHFLHPPSFCYSACNILDTLCIWCLPGRLPYCPHIAAQCGSSFLYIFLLTGISCVFACWHTLGHICYMMLLMVIHQYHHYISEYVQDLLLILHWHAFQACFNVYCSVAHLVSREHSRKTCSL